MTSIATQEEIRLLSKSIFIDRYENLKNILITFLNRKKPIYIDDIKYLEKEDPKTYMIFRFSFQEIVEECSKEWIYIKIIDTIQKTCDLCGNNRLRYNYLIKNKYNGKEMIVGSKCIDKFPDIDRNGKNLNKEKLQAIKIERISKINKQYENIIGTMESWKKYYMDFPIMLNEDLDSRFTKLIKSSKLFYENYINPKMKSGNIMEFEKYIEEFEALKLESNLFYENYKDSKYNCDKKIIYWLKQNKPAIHKKIMREGGLISKDAAKEIGCIDFINRFEDKIVKTFNGNNFVIEKINVYDGVIISTTIFNRYKLTLSLTLKEFVSQFSSIFYDDTSFINKEYIFNKFNLYMKPDNLSQLVIITNEILFKKPYRVENIFDEGNIRNEMIVKKNNNQEITISIYHFYKIMSSIFYNDRKRSNIVLNDYFKLFKSWKSCSKYNKNDIEAARRNTRSYKDE